MFYCVPREAVKASLQRRMKQLCRENNIRPGRKRDNEGIPTGLHAGKLNPCSSPLWDLIAFCAFGFCKIIFLKNFFWGGHKEVSVGFCIGTNWQTKEPWLRVTFIRLALSFNKHGLSLLQSHWDWWSPQVHRACRNRKVYIEIKQQYLVIKLI